MRFEDVHLHSLNDFWDIITKSSYVPFGLASAFIRGATRLQKTKLPQTFVSLDSLVGS